MFLSLQIAPISFIGWIEPQRFELWESTITLVLSVIFSLIFSTEIKPSFEASTISKQIFFSFSNLVKGLRTELYYANYLLLKN